MATMAMSPVEILPRPSQLRGRAGATSQASPPRIHRAGPLVFVNSSDLNTDSEKLINRKMVKKWAMLNRNPGHLRSSNLRAKAQFLSFDSKRPSRESSVCTPETDESQVTQEASEPIQTPASEGTETGPVIGITRERVSVTHQFNKLCIELDDHGKRLFEYFLKGGHGDMEAPNGRLVTCNRLTDPMITKSPAALCSLIATLESNPQSPVRSGSKQYRDYYLSRALTHTNMLIKNMDQDRTPAVFFCVSHLMWISHILDDERAITVHFNGMAALLVRHWDVFATSPYFRNGPLFWTFPVNEGNIIPQHSEPSIYSLPTPDMVATIERSDFTLMRGDGFISSNLVTFLPHILAMQALIPSKANNYTISVEAGKDLISYILFNGRTLNMLESHAISSMDHCTTMAATICYYTSIFRNSTAGVGWLAGSMQQYLMNTDLSMPMDEYPSVILWLVLAAGQFAKYMAREWWLDLLVSVRNVMRLYSFEDAVFVMEDRLLWTRNLDEGATHLWDEATVIIRGFSMEPL